MECCPRCGKGFLVPLNRVSDLNHCGVCHARIVGKVQPVQAQPSRIERLLYAIVGCGRLAADPQPRYRLHGAPDQRFAPAIGDLNALANRLLAERADRSWASENRVVGSFEFWRQPLAMRRAVLTDMEALLDDQGWPELSELVVDRTH
jgi:hypothetical protein